MQASFQRPEGPESQGLQSFLRRGLIGKRGMHQAPDLSPAKLSTRLFGVPSSADARRARSRISADGSPAASAFGDPIA